MGTEITLDVAGTMLTYSKNGIGIDHGMLFQDGDLIDFGEGDDRLNDWQFGEAFVRPLAKILPRLSLLGYDIERARRNYKDVVAEDLEMREAISDNDLQAHHMSFDEFRAFATSVSLSDLSKDFIEGCDDRDEEQRRIMGRFDDEALKRRIPGYSPYDPNAYSEAGYFVDLIGILDPYLVLVLLGENPANLDAEISWNFGPLVSAGWARREDFRAGARRRQTFLIATEGTSDIGILKRALELIYPDITDFFRFVDTAESHPFAGTGRMVNFAQGCARIDVQNQILFLLDNDAEGLDAKRRIERLAMPANMAVLTLPDRAELSAMPAVGPHGPAVADINGRAAAIECYLDLGRSGLPEPVIRWTAFKETVDAYQGVLQQKEAYSRAFFRDSALPDYDLSKLRALVSAIFSACCRLSSNVASRARHME
ncbi:MAG: HEPN/Toprim-associated domain-containing protein [Pseudomonadota bacterium]